ncbi:transcriptional repressor NrdR, partial [Mycobacterium tuberculosis]|nr:transcriptional repressor NrdR [Mycobacterium tuberculosis]
PHQPARRKACTGRRVAMEATSLSVIKRSGVTEEFSRQKIMSGVRKACQGRPVGDDDLAKLAQKVEEDIGPTRIAHIAAAEVGLSIREPLLEL